MLNFSRESDPPEDLPEVHPEQPEWDREPEPQIVEITPDSDKPALPPSLEQGIIADILKRPDLFKLPSVKKADIGKTLN